MRTIATIRFKDNDEEYFLYRGQDGYPENVRADIEDVIKLKKNSWEGSGCGCLVSCFLGFTFNEKDRLPNYELTMGFNGDESFKYFVTWDENEEKWVVNVF